MTESKQQLSEGTQGDPTNGNASKEEVPSQEDPCKVVAVAPPSSTSPVRDSAITATTATTTTATAANDKVKVTNDSNVTLAPMTAAAAIKGDDENKAKTNQTQSTSVSNDIVESVKIDRLTDNTGANSSLSPAAESATADIQAQGSVENTSTKTTITANTTAEMAVGPTIPTPAQPAMASSLSSIQNPPQLLQAPVRKVEPAIFAVSSQMGQIPNNILKLLQTYGPLTESEIAYNIPPTELSVPSILEVMKVLNVIHYHEESGYYYFHNGEIRGDTLYPSEIVDIIQDTQEEIKETMERIQLLKEELQKDVNIQNRARSAREFLKNLVGKYDGEGGIRGDPVYATALKTLNVDLGMKRKMAEVEPVKKKKLTRKKRKEDVSSSKVLDGSSIGDDVKDRVVLKNKESAMMQTNETVKDGQNLASGGGDGGGCDDDNGSSMKRDDDVTTSPKNETQSIIPLEQKETIVMVEQPQQLQEQQQQLQEQQQQQPLQQQQQQPLQQQQDGLKKSLLQT